MVDSAQRSLLNPFRDELTLSEAETDAHGSSAYQECLQEPFLRGCDTLMDNVRTQKIALAKRVLKDVLENKPFQQRWGLLGEDYVIGNAVQLTAYIFDSQEFAARNVAYHPSTFSLGGDPEMDSLVTAVWFLRRDVTVLHYEFCYPLCEGKLTAFGRARLALARFYLRHAIKSRLLILRREHRGTLVIAELIMIGLAFCVERLMRSGLTSRGTSDARVVRTQSVTLASAFTCSGLAAGDSAGAVDAGSGGVGKVQNRSGRRRRWVVVT
ncbi:hypothetical protein JKF63_00777 [Porcisia hertigi]|uniref:Uncharacterized protein n=1 Tax=Porcisia hertigi TaxID=2761500 RepID=A0A836L1C8_9TRYP|nr:hypothetical protein JKF63_00777 [Porcisia hertigi]